MKEAKKIKKMLLSQGFARVNYTKDVKHELCEVVKAWRVFCNQSTNHKEMIPFETNGGYENKDRRINPESRDHKEDFHITQQYTLPASFNPKPADTALILAGQNLLKAIQPTLFCIAHLLSEVTGRDFVKLAVENEDGWVLRLLHYYPGNMDKIPAHDHCDKGGHTLHLYDSTPGFERFWDGKWQNLHFTEDELAFFVGLLGQLESNCKLKALSHRVVTTNEIVKNGRISLVLFNDYPSSDFSYNKDEFGPVQKWLKPGMNYAMSRDELEFYFKRRNTQDAR